MENKIVEELHNDYIDISEKFNCVIETINEKVNINKIKDLLKQKYNLNLELLNKVDNEAAKILGNMAIHKGKYLLYNDDFLKDGPNKK